MIRLATVPSGRYSDRIMKHEALLDAAECVLFERGTQALTLAAVAERAGVSKGGLLYHFPNKEALVRALVARLIEEFDALVARHEGDSYSRADVKATFDFLAGEDSERTQRRWTAITAAAASPALIAPLREAISRWHRPDPGDDPDPLIGLIARLASEGLCEVTAHNPRLYDAEQYAALRQRLLDLLG